MYSEADKIITTSMVASLVTSFPGTIISGKGSYAVNSTSSGIIWNIAKATRERENATQQVCLMDAVLVELWMLLVI